MIKNKEKLALDYNRHQEVFCGRRISQPEMLFCDRTVLSVLSTLYKIFGKSFIQIYRKCTDGNLGIQTWTIRAFLLNLSKRF